MQIGLMSLLLDACERPGLLLATRTATSPRISLNHRSAAFACLTTLGCSSAGEFGDDWWGGSVVVADRDKPVDGALLPPIAFDAGSALCHDALEPSMGTVHTAHCRGRDQRADPTRRHTMTRKVADCRDYPSENNCTLTISGEEDEVIEAATQHAVAKHGHGDTAEVRQWLKENLKDEVPA